MDFQAAVKAGLEQVPVQCFGNLVRRIRGMYDNEFHISACTLGLAMIGVVGKEEVLNNGRILVKDALKQFPWLFEIITDNMYCPDCNINFRGKDPRTMIVHLNDTHKWKAEDIAEYVTNIWG